MQSFWKTCQNKTFFEILLKSSACWSCHGRWFLPIGLIGGCTTTCHLLCQYLGIDISLPWNYHIALQKSYNQHTSLEFPWVPYIDRLFFKCLPEKIHILPCDLTREPSHFRASHTTIYESDFQQPSGLPSPNLVYCAQVLEQLSPDGEKKREKLKENIKDEVLFLLMSILRSLQNLFEVVIEQAKKVAEKDVVKKKLQEFASLSNEIKSLPSKLVKKEDIEKMIQMFKKYFNLAISYINNQLSEADKFIKKIMDENNLLQLLLTYIASIVLMFEMIKKRIQEYVNSLSSEDKKKDVKYVQFLEKTKNASSIFEQVEVIGDLIGLMNQ